MTIVEEVLAFTRAYVNNQAVRTRENKEKIRVAYRQVTGEQLTTNCGTCLIEALFKIKMIMEKQPCKYLLKPGALRTPIFGDTSTQFTNANITDELAEMDLRLNPGAKIYYSRIPEPEIIPAEKTKIIPAEKVPSETKPDTKADVVIPSESKSAPVKRSHKKKTE
jgi:hypothetical protein